ncbi:MAG: carbamoyl phosphate synthase large subunit, partial [bacterium]
MPARKDIKRILVIGSGPVVMGQSAEFDCGGVEACKALRDEGYFVISAGSNPTAAMTDPDVADRTYIEPLTPEAIERIIIKERPDALLATMGGQTALNLAAALSESGVLKKRGVKLLGADAEAIAATEHTQFMSRMKPDAAKDVLLPGGVAATLGEAKAIVRRIGFPVALRPSFAAGGAGSSISYNMEDFEDQAKLALEASPAGRIIVEKSIFGWREVEFELLRDSAGSVIVISSLENTDPVGVHSGDSTTIVPAQTLNFEETGRLSVLAKAAVNAIAVRGCANVRFAINPDNGVVAVLAVAPCFTRSSALAWKATGYPVARIAAKLACGIALDELKLDGGGTAFHEPSPDYIVTK